MDYFSLLFDPLTITDGRIVQIPIFLRNGGAALFWGLSYFFVFLFLFFGDHSSQISAA